MMQFWRNLANSSPDFQRQPPTMAPQSLAARRIEDANKQDECESLCLRCTRRVADGHKEVKCRFSKNDLLIAEQVWRILV